MEVDPISDNPVAPVPDTLEQLNTEQRLLDARAPLFDPTAVVGKTPDPFDLWTVDVATGKGRPLTEAEKKYEDEQKKPSDPFRYQVSPEDVGADFDPWETIPFPADQAEKDKAAAESGERPATRSEIEEMFAKRGEIDALFGLPAADLAEYIEKRSKSGDVSAPTIQSLMLARRDQWDDETKAKATEVWKILNERGAQPGGLGFSKLIPGAVDFVKGLGAWTGKAMQGQDAWALGLLNAVTPGPETPEVRQKRLEAQQVAAEAVSGMQAGGEHLAKIPGVIVENLFGKPAKDWTPKDSAERLTHSLTEQINTENTLAGERGFTQSPEVRAEMKDAGLGVRAEESAKVMAGNPVDFWAFGKGLGVIAPIFRIPTRVFRAATLAGRGAEAEAAFVASLPQSLQGAMVGAFEREAAKRSIVGEVSKAAGEIIGPAARNVSRTLDAAGNLIPSAQTVVGKSIQGAGAVADWLGKWSEKAAPTATRVATAAGLVGGATSGLGQVVAGFLAGGGTVSRFVKPVMATINAIRKQAQKLEYSGKSIAAQTEAEIAGAPIKGAASAAVVGAAKSVPQMVAATAHGAVLDIGLFALTAATPQDQNVLQLGTILGLANSLRGAAVNAAGEVKHGGRDWGHDTPLPTSGTFPVWEKMHSDAYGSATPGVKRRVNAIRKLLKDVDADTDSFMADPTHVEHRQVGTIKIGDTTHVKWAKINTDVESTLISLGMPKDRAEFYASQSGFFDARFGIPGQPGKTKRVFVVVDSGTAPHEAKHAFQDVNGEAANLALDKIVQDSFTPGVWDYLGLDYTQKLVDRRLRSEENWQDLVLEASGEGNAAANLKLKLHGIEVLQEKLGRPATKAEVDALEAVNLTEGELVPVTAEVQGGWRNVLTPAEQKQAADKYIAREIAADTFATVFKHFGPALAEKGGLINTFARVVAATVDALGGDLLRGRITELGIPLKQPIVEAVTAQVRGRLAEVAGKKPIITPKIQVPKGMSSAAPPGTPEQEADKAKQVAESAPDETTGPDEVRSDGTIVESQTAREVLGAAAEAMALRGSMMLDYRSAKGTPAGVIEVMLDRSGRRGQVEEGRGMSAEDKILWEKLFTPVKVAVTQAGEYQVQGIAQRVLGRNANEVARFLSDVNPALSPFEIDVANKTFTEAGWRNLFDKIGIYNGNQAAGLTGKGTPLEIGRAREFGFYEPAGNRQKVGDLTDAEMNFINYLFGYPLPGAGKAVIKRGGKAQYAEQLISQATEPGRAQPLVEPRTFGSKQAEQLGFAGEQLLEVNPFRAQIEELARAMMTKPPSPIEAWQNLNLKDIVRAQHTPELPSLAGNEVTKRAGFSPKMEGTGYESHRDLIDDVNSGKFGEIFGFGYRSDARKNWLRTVADIADAADPLEALQLVAEEKASVKGKLPAKEIREMLLLVKYSPKKDEDNLGKTFDTFVEGFRAAIQEGQPELAQGFLEKAASAAKFQRTLARKGDVSEFGDRTIDETFNVQTEQVQALQKELDVSKKATNIFLDPGLAAKVWEAGGKLKQVPPQQSMEGTGFKSNSELVEKYLSRTGHDEPGWYPTFYGADRGEGQWKVTELRLAAQIADGVNPIADINAMSTEIGTTPERQASFRRAIIRHIQDFESIKNERRIASNYFGKRAPFSQPFRPGPAKFAPMPANDMAIRAPAMKDETTGRIYEGFIHAVAQQDAESRGAKGPFTRGFVTNRKLPNNKIEFLNVDEAFDRAEKIGQLPEGQLEMPGGGLESTRFEEVRRFSPPKKDKGYEAGEYWLGGGKLNYARDGHLDWVFQNVGEGRMEEPSGKRGELEDAYRLAEDNGYLRTVISDNRIDVGSSQRYPAWRDVPKELRDAIEDVQFSRDLSVYFAGRLVSEAPGVPVKFSPAAERKEIELIGPDGKKYRAMFDGYQDFSASGLGHIAQITPLEDLPGSKVAGSTTYGSSLEKAGYKLPADLPAPEIAETGEAQFAPRKRKEADPLKFIKGTYGSMSKAWILPSGKVEQLGAQWHHHWLSEHPEVAKRYKLDVPAFEGGDTEGVRESALKEGFARVNFDGSTLTIEAREKDWSNVRPIVEDMIEKNLDDIDKFRINLLDDSVSRLKKSYSEKLFDADNDQAKMDRVFEAFSEDARNERGAAFSPKTDAGRKLEDDGFRFRVRKSEGFIDIELMPKGKQNWVGSMFAELLPDGTAKVGSVKVEPDFQERGIAETLYRELATHLQELGIESLAGDVIHPAPMKIREKLFGGSEVLGEKSTAGGGYAKQVKSRVDPEAVFSPKREEFEDPETIREALSSPGWAIITGTQEKIAGKAASWDDPRNIAANARLRAELKAKGYEVLPVEGKYKGESQGESFAVMGITPADAQALGKKYGQESILTNKGLVYGDGSTTPAVPEKTMIGPEAEAQDFYSITPDGTAFSIGLDFDKPYKPVGEQQELFGKTDSEAQDFSRRIRARVADKKERFPESAPLGYEKNADGSFRINAKTGKPVPEKQFHNFLDSGLAKESGKGLRGEAREAAYVKAAGDAMAAEYQKAVKNPEIAAGAKWYSTLRTRLRKLFGGQAQLVCEVLAATSARTPVDLNYRFGIDAVNKFNAGDYDAQLKKYQEGLDNWDAGNISDYTEATGLSNPKRGTFVNWWIDAHDLKPRQSNGKLFGANSKQVLRALHGSWEGGKKTRQFSQNMSGEDFGSTIDVWSARELHQISNEGRLERWRILPEHETAVQDEDFDVAQKVFKHAADKVGVKPDAFQSVLWFKTKDVWEKKGWTRGAGAEKSDFSSLVKETEKTPSGSYRLKNPQLELLVDPR